MHLADIGRQLERLHVENDVLKAQVRFWQEACSTYEEIMKEHNIDLIEELCKRRVS